MAALAVIDRKLQQLIGRGQFGEDPPHFYVEFPLKEFSLPINLVDSWVSRPQIITRYPEYNSPAKPFQWATLVVGRFPHIDSALMDGDILARGAELRLIPADPKVELHDVYNLKTWWRSRGKLQVGISHHKNNPEYDSPIWGEHDEQPEEDELDAFNRFLNYTLKTEPVRVSTLRYRLTV